MIETKQKIHEFKQVEVDPPIRIPLPCYTICRVCRNNLTDLCEPCMAPEGRSWFEPRKDVNIDNAPRFPVDEIRSRETPVKVKADTMAFYMDIMVARLQEKA